LDSKQKKKGLLLEQSWLLKKLQLLPRAVLVIKSKKSQQLLPKDIFITINMMIALLVTIQMHLKLNQLIKNKSQKRRTLKRMMMKMLLVLETTPLINFLVVAV